MGTHLLPGVAWDCGCQCGGGRKGVWEETARGLGACQDVWCSPAGGNEGAWRFEPERCSDICPGVGRTILLGIQALLTFVSDSALLCPLLASPLPGDISLFRLALWPVVSVSGSACQLLHSGD